ncbi:hypothetical protein PG999_009173 [Apiospora kogelbergensis]|uniref:Major Facilitator Superfamily protein n=1 Tax=Apiospora kogelbergensis TaxID=1337665 RepID=A0AAW0QJW5_9PEZI
MQQTSVRPENLDSDTKTIAARERRDGLDDQTTRLPFGRLIAAYLCLAAIYFVSTLDINLVSTALPAISHSLGGADAWRWIFWVPPLTSTLFKFVRTFCLGSGRCSTATLRGAYKGWSFTACQLS